MPDAVGDTLPLDGLEGLADLVLVLEGLLVDEGVELGLPIIGLDLTEDQLDGLEHVCVRHIPNGLNVQPLVRIPHFESLMDF